MIFPNSPFPGATRTHHVRAYVETTGNWRSLFGIGGVTRGRWRDERHSEDRVAATSHRVGGSLSARASGGQRARRCVCRGSANCLCSFEPPPGESDPSSGRAPVSRAVIAHGSGAMRRCARAAASAAGLTRRAAETFLGGAIRAELPAAYHTSSARCGAIVSANALRARAFSPEPPRARTPPPSPSAPPATSASPRPSLMNISPRTSSATS